MSQQYPISKEDFAKWTFEFEKKSEMYDESMTWDKLHPAEQDLFKQEAEFYFTMPLDKWPLDVLDRLPKGK